MGKVKNPIVALGLLAGSASVTAAAPVLDAPIPGQEAALQRFKSGHLGQIVLPYLWHQNVVTVAFNGGNEATDRLIEAAANEWTIGHSSFFHFCFRVNCGSRGPFRTWSGSDAQQSADVRVAFDADGGYSSLVGTEARYQSPALPTMNFAGFPHELPSFSSRADWKTSYRHAAILHEFGHALGLVHEHFHGECQPELKFVPDPGYEITFDDRGRPTQDSKGRSPGIYLFNHEVYNWETSETDYQMRAGVYFNKLSANVAAQNHSTLRQEPSLLVNSDAHVDQKSIMLYYYPAFMFTGGASSKCMNLGDGHSSDPTEPDRFATKPSARDYALFESYYSHSLENN